MTNLDTTKFSGIGRRKTAIAIVNLVPNLNPDLKPLFLINDQISDQYFSYNLNYITRIESPLKKVELLNQYQISVSVKGGGLTGQADAITLGLSRALCKLDNINFRPILKSNAFLSRDARIKERRKYGLKKARKASQSSKR